MHLTIDGKAGNELLMSEPSKLAVWLMGIVDFINMTRIDGPHVVKFENYGWGITGVIILAESHVSVHTFPESGWVYIDVFSCRKFHHTQLSQKVSIDFGIQGARVSLNKNRGNEWRE